ncbi:hypothetical protein JTE90_006363 [Oedothorax gibbosus]|uniref:DNA-directed primase/polymerase protein n=1 Tax=Oedothorax gibbosus TaxID=931172 RepID=A0AAV6VXH2_9ARAC|nr:hypothetical protein JTE90_006363 [Oedothorax gibbosus]
MSKETETDRSVDRLAEEFYRPCNSTGVFCQSVVQLRKTYKEHIAKPIPASPKFRLDGPSVAWKIFKKLNHASAYADSFTKDCMVFSYEEKLPESSGQRLFLVTHPQHLWLNYKLRPLQERNTYEVIREDVPCKLYFDLEFNKAFNFGIDGIKITNIFIKCIIAAMFEDYNLELSNNNFLWLDSSSDKKYICHLILQIPDVAFVNNVQAGYFVSKMLSNIRKIIETKEKSKVLWPSYEELECLFVTNADDRSVTFCDDGVYTKNRNFRLFLSTKYGKNVPLVLSDNNQYRPDLKIGKPRFFQTIQTSCPDENLKRHYQMDETIFYDSLVTYFRNGKTYKRLLSCDPFGKANTASKGSLSSKLKLGFSGVSPSIGPSPYPEVDEFISSVVKDEISSGFIRKWSYLDSEEVIIYDIGGFRYCARIGRHHKSNNIMIIVDMRSKIYYQKCHDPECRAQGFKSIAKPLPEYIASLYNIPDDFFEENCFTQLPTQLNMITDTSDDNITNNNLHKISNEFLEDLCLDSYPFTQLCMQESKNNTNGITNAEEMDTKSQVVQDLEQEQSFAADTSFDDLCMEDLESEFATQSVKDGPETVGDPPCDTFSENANSNTDEMYSDDDLMLAEAASVIEVSFSDSMFSEETIF